MQIMARNILISRQRTKWHRLAMCPKTKSPSVRSFEQNMKLLCQAAYENRVDDKFESLVTFARLIQDYVERARGC